MKIFPIIIILSALLSFFEPAEFVGGDGGFLVGFLFGAAFYFFLLILSWGLIKWCFGRFKIHIARLIIIIASGLSIFSLLFGDPVEKGTSLIGGGTAFLLSGIFYFFLLLVFFELSSLVFKSLKKNSTPDDSLE